MREERSSAVIAAALREARGRTLELVRDLDDEQLIGPRLPIVNPLLWEIGHVAWFQENFVLRRLRGEPPILDQGDRLYDSMAVAHDTRWDLPLLSRDAVLSYMSRVLERIVEPHEQAGAVEASADEAYFCKLALFHEDMHDEAFLYSRQTLGYPAPRLPDDPLPVSGEHEICTGDVEFEGGVLRLGAERDGSFVFDNEKWAHPVEVGPFRMARTAVSQGEFREFLEDRGYGRRELWCDAGWSWREGAAVTGPAYWRRSGDGFERRRFDEWVPLEEQRPVLHVNWYEASAYCRWAGRRLPSEAEWELAAGDGVQDPASKRKHAWGGDEAGPRYANLDAAAGGCVEVGALPAGDTPNGCRQLTGNVWEWTASLFMPYPGFSADAYKDYSEPWFGEPRVLRGGCWATRSRMIRNVFRSFYTPDRRDVWAGFRTCD